MGFFKPRHLCGICGQKAHDDSDFHVDEFRRRLAEVKAFNERIRETEAIEETDETKKSLERFQDAALISLDALLVEAKLLGRTHEITSLLAIDQS